MSSGALNTHTLTKKSVPFFRPAIGDAEIEEVTQCLRSGWLTTGSRTAEFETRFADSVHAEHAVAVNSCTAALHLAVEALGLQAGEAVIVPTMTFAATAEIVLYRDAVPILVDCDPETLHLDLEDATQKLQATERGDYSQGRPLKVVGMIPVHVGGLMMDLDSLDAFASKYGLWVVEDAAHAFPAAYRSHHEALWRSCGSGTAQVTCYSFYANKTMTTGEGGMAVTQDAQIASRIRQMSLHGLSHDAWQRYCGTGSWDYRIVAPGYKYNMTDIAASIGVMQLKRAEAMRDEREEIAGLYRNALMDVEQLELPPDPLNRIHAWHLFPIRLRLEALSVDRNEFVNALREHGISTSVHWRPLHLHPLYSEKLGWSREEFPVASKVWETLVSLPLFPGMQEAEIDHVVTIVRELCSEFAAVRMATSSKPR